MEDRGPKARLVSGTYGPCQTPSRDGTFPPIAVEGDCDWAQRDVGASTHTRNPTRLLLTIRLIILYLLLSVRARRAIAGGSGEDLSAVRKYNRASVYRIGSVLCSEALHCN